MELRFIAFCMLMIVGTQVSAKDNVDNLIKQQKNADASVLHEQQFEKKDVFSNTDRKVFTLQDLPREENCFTVKNVLLENDFLKAKITQSINENIAGRCIGVAGINTVASALQDYYIDAGYVTTRVIIPTQNISTGELKFTVEAGKIENVIVAGDDILAWMLPFKNEDILNIRDIEQGLENLQFVPGVNVKINIEPGSQNGYSNVSINTNRFKKWSVRASYNNWGDEATGQYLTSAVGYLFNTAKLGDLFYLAGTSSTTGKYQNISGYYSFPVGYWNYTFFYSKSDSRQTVPLSYFSLDYAGNSEYLSAKAARTVYRDKSRKIAASAELIRRTSGYTLDGEELVLQSRDMGNVKFGLNYKQQFADASLDATLSWQRFLTWFGGEQTPDMQYGEVSPISQLFNFQGNYTQLFANGYYNGSFYAQYAPRQLTLQDQMTAGDRWSVRGFENSYGLTGNSGFYLQNTFYRPIGTANARLYFGMDFGQVKEDGYYGDEIIAGGAMGIEGNIKSLGYDFSITTPLKYPGDLVVNKTNFNFNFSYQL
ncbi:Hemolysin activation/secretion protein [Kosakonia radicincitans]|uniref:ShlB/FhaC/HecB family hemolysin secretion/activation protein n=1 Tax=Kosakonia radicincitans TaxID=283686 RepID=UPI0009A89046|nr:ShlB/FhaC/HecB family hemolysin secretion/activation protein [Kosakonia radicincitans]SKC06070.1 Hemolysin activation/secretion protein [Kosakonia radicincitans]